MDTREKAMFHKQEKGKSQQWWADKLVSPQTVLRKIKPGMAIFIGTGVAEPRTLVKALRDTDAPNLQDLELIQLVSLGEAIAFEDRYSQKFRLKTFFAGWVASEAIKAGRVDLIPCRFSRIPKLIASGTIQIDVAMVQITPPDESGYSSLGVAVDVAREAMTKASVVVGEINEAIPRTMGDTFVHVSNFDYLVQAKEEPLYFPRPPVDKVHERLAAHVASLIPNGSCLSFSVGPLFEALSRHLTMRRDLGIHCPIFTDALMDLVKSGAVSNRKKGNFKGKCLAAYALGTPELMRWLHNNPLIEFQPIDVVADPKIIGAHDRFVVVLPARKVDLTGAVALPAGKGNIAAGPGEAQEFFAGAALSRHGRTIFALPSRNLRGESNILLSIQEYPNQFSNRESLDLVVTEYGVASLIGKTIRERAMALIDIAHPDDREALVEQAKRNHILFPDQIYLAESSRLYPEDLTFTQVFKGDLVVRFRPIKPSDVEAMRKLFYRFSDEAVYYRYFSPIKTMPFTKMQEYVNVDYRNTMSLVGLTGEPGEEQIIAEGRYVRAPRADYADLAFVVDEAYQGRGIATYLLELLCRIARDRGIKEFHADVLANNKAMIKVFEKSSYPFKAVMNSGVYEITIPLASNA